MPFLRRKGKAWQVMVDGKPFLMLSGELHNSSSSSLEYLEPLWGKLVALRLNTVIAAVSWELLEPREGQFDFTLVDGLVRAARAHGLRLILLWFGTWKNTWSTYAPEWVKLDPRRFFRACDEQNRLMGSISCFCEAACDADTTAFAALMRHIREIDAGRHTVLMAQVQNETGLLGASRDHAAAATAAFAQPVPRELLAHLAARRDGLRPELLDAWMENGFKEGGDWRTVFGQGAEEIFMAWHIARYVDHVAAAGKAEHPLPLFANAWLIWKDSDPPGRYPSGGPVSKMMDVWRAAAPNLDILAPDIYLDDFRSACDSYVRHDNPLLIPEANRDMRAAANAFYAFGQCGALCFAPFGIDSCESGHPLSRTYELLASLAPLLVESQSEGRTRGFVQQAGEAEASLELGGHRLRISYLHPHEKGTVPGCGLVIDAGEGEIVFAGRGFKASFAPWTEAATLVTEILAVDEGSFVDGEWRQGRRLNGDEFEVMLPVEGGTRRVKVHFCTTATFQDAIGVALQGIA